VVSLFAQNSQNNYTLERAMIKLNQMASIWKLQIKELENKTVLLAFQIGSAANWYQGPDANLIDYDHNVSICNQYFPMGKNH
jgi:hypothetical protein